jgi:hypothetical protein
MKSRWVNLLATGSLGALLVSCVGLTPARADRDYDRALRAVHHDLDVINRDQKHIDDLSRKADDQRYHHDWRGVRRTEDQIDRARTDLRRDRENLRADQRALDNYGRSDRGHNHNWNR